MPEAKNYVFSHAELAEVLVKRLDIHEGNWGVYLEFGLGAGNIPQTADQSSFIPAAVCFVNKIGIQKFDTPTNLTVDAAQVNPARSVHHQSKK
jgi:hypothetical protein